MKPIRVLGASALAFALVAGCTIEGPAISGVSDVDGVALSDDDRYVVTFDDGTAARDAIRSAGGSVVLELPGRNAMSVNLPAVAVAGISHNPHITLVEPDARRYPTSITPYGIGLVQANDAIFSGVVGSAKVCIIDSGYWSGHEDLTADTAIVDGTNDPGTGNWNDDDCGHGTHVAGTISAAANGVGVVGVLPNTVPVHIVKVFSGADCGWAYSSSLVAALDECAAHGAKVINMSLGGGMKNRFEEVAFNDAYNNLDILPIAAAGNDGNNRKSYPASYAGVVSVAAVDANSVIADFSQFNSAVEVAAPGVSVLSTVPWLSISDLTVNGTTYTGSGMEGSLQGNVSGTLVDGGLCDSAGSWSGAVVLCERGNISFADKVANVEAGGGAAAVIYNNNGGGIFSGTLGGAATTIISITLSAADGNALVASSLGASGDVAHSFTPNASGYESWDGTSMATPHVTGVAALLWSVFPGASNADIRDALTGTALDLGDPGRDNFYGYGLIQAVAAHGYLAGLFGSCGDGIAGGSEDCDGADLAGADCGDFGFIGGTLSCDAACGFDTSACVAAACGDGVANGSESCDGADLAGTTCEDLGFIGGTLSCDGGCGFDTSACASPVCGDGVANGSESCDGTDLRGNDCTTLGMGFTGGTLSCDLGCGFDTTACTAPMCTAVGDSCVEDIDCCSGSCSRGRRSSRVCLAP